MQRDWTTTEEEMSTDIEQKLQGLFDHVLLYEDMQLQAAAKRLVPVEILDALTESEMEMLVLEKKVKYSDLCKKDLMLCHLTKWFREDFFTWFDVAECSTCKTKMQNTHNLEPMAEERRFGAGRVEGYSCSCGNTSRFPRYNHPGKLLETRKGRCGEWANCFTLICRSLGYEARYVYDFTDHVWTEVFSSKQNRWLHCDTGEGGIDKPLLYESGWGKKLNYVIAFTKDEIQDVTWRYSSNHSVTLTRRTQISEYQLVKFLLRLTDQRQKGYSEVRKKELLERRILELAELLVERKAESGELAGRQSGSLAWRIARGELGKSPAISVSNGYVWGLNLSDLATKGFELTYNPATDVYMRRGIHDLRGWEKGVFSTESIFLKKEKDWKMVYLARKEGSLSGKIAWKFSTLSHPVTFKNVQVSIPITIFEEGRALLRVSSGSKDVLLKEISSNFEDLDVSLIDCRELTVELEVFGSKGDNAWQHAQICRRSLNETSTVGIFRIFLQIE